MANPVAMPKQGITVESCILTKWNVKVGDSVKVGDNLFSYETDKSAFDFQSEVEGEVLAIFAQDGDEVPVLTNVCVIGKKGEDVSSFAPNGSSAPVVEEVKPTAEVVGNSNVEQVINSNAKPVMMPKQGITVESCILTKWNVKVGDSVKVGDNLFSYETDKASFDFQSEVEGEVLAIFAEDGDEVPVLTNVCVIGKKGDAVDCFRPNGSAPVVAEEVKAPTVNQTIETVASVQAPVANKDGKILIVTYMGSAVNNFKQRISAKLEAKGINSRDYFVSTIHSLCMQIPHLS